MSKFVNTFATFNVNGVRNIATQEMVREFLRNKSIDIACLQEVNQENLSWIFPYKYISNPGTNNRGTAIIYRSDFEVSDVLCDTEGRIISVDIANIRLINVYSPSGSQRKAERELFFAKDVPIHFSLSNKPVILIGDFNCTLRREDSIGSFNFCNNLNALVSNLNLKDVWLITNINKQIDYTFQRGNSASRIDRAYIPEHICCNVNRSKVFSIPFSDHHALLFTMTTAEKTFTLGWGPFKIPNYLLSKNQVFETNTREIEKAKTQRLYTVDKCQWWYRLKANLKGLLKSTLIEMRLSHKRSMAFYESYLEDLRSKTPSPLVTKEIKNIKSKMYQLKYDFLLELQEDRNKGSLVVDDNINLYQLIKKYKLNKKINICKLAVKNEMIFDKKLIINQFYEYYKLKFANKDEIKDSLSLRCMLNHINKQLSNENIQDLCKPFTVDEVNFAIKNAKKSSSPGLDGLPYKFYQMQTENISLELCNMYNSFFSTSQTIPEKGLEGVITLIPKKKNPVNISDYRPITLLNCDIKILNKVLANRIKSKMNIIISPSQKCSVEGRKITDNLITMRNLIIYCSSSNKNVSLLNIDFESAFDRVSHNYLWMVLEKFRFPNQIISLSKKIYEGATSVVLVNGCMTKKIPLLSGVRQGCPLSMILFAISLEPFIQLIHFSLSGLNIFSEKLLCIAYADDVNIIITHESELKIIKNIIAIYERAANAKINQSKSNIITLAGNPMTSNGFREVESVKTLGLTLFKDFSMMVKRNWECSINSIRVQLGEVRMRNLCVIKRVKYINIYILSKVWYLSQVIPLQDEFIKKIESMCYQFIWSGFIFKTSKAQLLLPENKGGLNLCSVELKAISLFAKEIFKLLNSEKTNFNSAFIHKVVYDLLFSDSQENEIPVDFRMQLENIFDLDLDFEKDCTTKAIYKKLYLSKIYDINNIELKYPEVKWKNLWENISNPYICDNWKSALYCFANDLYSTGFKKHKNKIGHSLYCVKCNEIDTLYHRCFECREVKDVWVWTIDILVRKLKVPPDKVDVLLILQADLTLVGDIAIFNAILWFISAIVFYALEHKEHNLDSFLNVMRAERMRLVGRQAIAPFKKFLFVF